MTKKVKKSKQIESENVAVSLAATFTVGDVKEILFAVRDEIQASADTIGLDSQSQIVARLSRAHAANMVENFARTVDR